ncbi:MAG TPA: hypothetical protein VF088_05945 [Pyrinomonadaceae bacterium]
MGPSFFAVNLGISRAFAFGNVHAAPAAAAAPAPSEANRPASGPAPENRYTVTFSVNIQNLLNTTNPNQPIGKLSSPQCGESISSAGSFGFGPSGSAAAGSRRIQIQVRFGF